MLTSTAGSSRPSTASGARKEPASPPPDPKPELAHSNAYFDWYFESYFEQTLGICLEKWTQIFGTPFVRPCCCLLNLVLFSAETVQNSLVNYGLWRISATTGFSCAPVDICWKDHGINRDNPPSSLLPRTDRSSSLSLLPLKLQQQKDPESKFNICIFRFSCWKLPRRHTKTLN